jgi:hypothetical protein
MGSLSPFLLLTHWANSLRIEMSAQAVFYNRYYWFRRFAEEFQRNNRPDAGIEQRSYQLLEQAGCDFDWTIVEPLDVRARQDQ